MGLASPLQAQSKLKGVAVTVGDLGNPFFVQIAHGAQAEAKKINPSVKFSAESSNYDVNNQTNQMDNFVSSGVSLILLNAADSKGIAPAVMRAKSSGIVVVAVDVGAEGGAGWKSIPRCSCSMNRRAESMWGPKPRSTP
jgi:ribose transport system substrate-binding protein